MAKLSLFNNKTKMLKDDAYALFLAIKDSRTPWPARIVAGLVVGYALSPIDLIPDFIPIIGWIDDLLILGFGMRLVRRLIPQQVWEEAKANALPIENKIRKLYRRAMWTLVGLWVGLIVISVAVVAYVAYYLSTHIGP